MSRPSRLSAEWSEAVPVSETERADAAGNLEIVFVDWLDALRRRDIERVERDYDRHATAAREAAAEHFDAKQVLGDLLRRIGLG